MKRFDGWEPTETTEYEYEFPGRLVRKVVTREAEWDEQEQAWMLALAEYRATRCPDCGRDVRECTDPASEGKYRVPPPDRCHATTALVIAQKVNAESPQPEALLWRVERR